MKKQDKNNKDVFLTDCMTLPGVPTSLPVLTLIGNREMYMENIKTIMEYNDTCVKILTKRGIVYVEGEHLDIGYLDADEISCKRQDCPDYFRLMPLTAIILMEGV
ncbi:MAG: YabP/YqfC family sporulation protein [Lachnospira eligens]